MGQIVVSGLASGQWVSQCSVGHTVVSGSVGQIVVSGLANGQWVSQCSVGQ